MLTICQSLTSLPVRSQGVAGGTIAIGINEVVPHLCGADVLIRTTLEVQLLVPIGTLGKSLLSAWLSSSEMWRFEQMILRGFVL